MITDRNNKIKANIITPTPVRNDPVPARNPTPEPKNETDSDTTMIYTPSTSPAKKRSSRGKAKFMLCIVGLKTHRNTDQVRQTRLARSRNFKCYLCGESFPLAWKLNQHFKIKHDGLDCDVFGKGFNSPLFLKKHFYTHQECKHKCTRCDKSFLFKSQCDTHEKVSDNLRFQCNQISCNSSLSRESDTRLHHELHDSAPTKCKHCDYENSDVRNIRQHMCTHTNERPYSCHQCGECFRFTMQKKRHKCPQCMNIWVSYALFVVTLYCFHIPFELFCALPMVTEFTMLHFALRSNRYTIIYPDV